MRQVFESQKYPNLGSYKLGAIQDFEDFKTLDNWVVEGNATATISKEGALKLTTRTPTINGGGLKQKLF